MIMNKIHSVILILFSSILIQEGDSFTAPRVFVVHRSANMHQSTIFNNAPKHVDSLILAKLHSNDADPGGLRRGLALFPIVVLFTVWLFSIPPDFRRARICTEQQVIDNPDSRCITTTNWVGGVQDYYRNGGGLKFDFSIDSEK